MPSRAASPIAPGAAVAAPSGTGRVAVCCRMRPLLPNEVAHGVTRAPWALTDKSISLRERCIGRQDLENWRDGGDGTTNAKSCKTRGELRNLDHLRRDDGETIMDNVFGEDATTQQVYEQSFRGIVAGVAEGLNGAILAYGQTSSGKTYSISGSTARPAEGEEGGGEKGIIHFALEDLFSQLRQKAASHKGTEYLVRMSYCELYMERVNDLLRKIGPQSQNLPVKEDAEGKGFYADGLKEKFVGSAEEVVELLKQAEKRRRVAYTRYNEVSSRSHTLMTLCVECSTPLEAADESTDAAAGEDAPQVTRVGRLVIVDLAGNERVEMGTEYMAESSSINKSLFFLGKVIEKLSNKDRKSGGALDDGEHVPFRDSKLTRLLSVHLGGNSHTGMLVTLTPAEEAIEQSMTTLRFAQKASLVKCVAKPVLISKEQSLIVKQREIIAQLHNQVKSLQEEAMQRTFSQPQVEELTAERQERAEQLQALVVSNSAPDSGQAFVSKSREVDTVVTALHRNNDVLKKQKATVVESMKELYKTVNEVAASVAKAAEELAAGKGAAAAMEALRAADVPTAPQAEDDGGGSARGAAAAWAPAVAQLRQKLQVLVGASIAAAAKKDNEVANASSELAAKLQAALEENRALRESSGSQAPAIASSNGVAGQGQMADEVRQLKEDNSKLRQSMKFLTAERERIQKELADFKAQLMAKDSPAPSSSCGPVEAEHRPGAWRPPRSPAVEEDAAISVDARPSSSSTPVFVGTGPASSSSSKPGAHSEPELQSVSSAACLGDFEPIIERGLGPAKQASRVAIGSSSSSSPLRRSASLVLSKSGSLGEFEPIIERGSGPIAHSEAPQPPLPGAHLGSGLRRNARSPARPQESRPPVPEVGAKMSQAYFRGLGGAKAKWSPGDVAYWRGQACKVLRGIPEQQPLCVVLRTPRGSEVTTDTCLLSEAPSAATSADALSAAARQQQQQLRLAPLGDLFLDRPGVAPDRPPGKPGSPRVASHGALPSGARGAPPRPGSRERSAGRASCGSPMRFATPPLCPTSGR
eukprot:gb/GFBE01058656.1/.p1 GENE.gb/GFBE01058656.1/~~gb/GFBE01058656.1/.p1  ORF type:complete len:1040 (+),score=214.15 gb/GFBE01058656.1/:1-3120(+)